MVAVSVAESRKMSALSVQSAGVQVALGSLRLRGVTSLDGVRRNLFGCVDPEENRRFVERELNRQLEIDSERWGFDFARETPLAGSRIVWQLVPASSVPAPFRRAAAVAAPAAPQPPPSAPPPPAPSTPSPNKTQKRITDFMKARKRLSASKPSGKHDCALRPAKLARIAPPRLKRS